MRRIVIDTNVLVSGLRSRGGASNKLLSLIGTERFVTAMWRPSLPDPKDHHVLEIAVAARCDTIVTFNRADFPDVDRFGIRLQTPGAFLKEINP
jgi:predicted nucleic acid-binding protein